MSNPYRENAHRPPRLSRLDAIVLGAVTAITAWFGITACTTHVLGPTDIAALKDSLELEGRIYCGSDGGMTRAFARGAFVSDRDVLARSGVVVDAGPACDPPGSGVPK